MRVIINGVQESCTENTSIAEVIHTHQEYEPHMIVELNRRFIHQKEYQSTLLSEGDILEMIHPAFGG